MAIDKQKDNMENEASQTILERHGYRSSSQSNRDIAVNRGQ